MSCNYICRIDYTPYDEQDHRENQPQIVNVYDSTEPFTDWVDTKFICNLPVIEGFSKCIYHKCKVPVCDDAIIKYSKYCKTHTCQHALKEGSRCCQQAIENNLCDKHKCMECNKNVFHQNAQYCKIHLIEMPCVIDGCKNTFPISEKKHRTCPLHTCVKCGNELRMRNVKYCWICVHQINDEENVDILEARDTYTNDEYCALGWCGRYKKNGKHCNIHQCKYANCNQPRLEEDVEMGDVIFKTNYCKQHHILNELCVVNYGFSLELLPLLNHIELDEHDKQNTKNKFILYIKQLADAII